jgi:hypothetical protein
VPYIVEVLCAELAALCTDMNSSFLCFCTYRRIKGALMADSFHIVGFKPYDRPVRGSSAAVSTTAAATATAATVGTLQQHTAAEVMHIVTTVL